MSRDLVWRIEAFVDLVHSPVVPGGGALGCKSVAKRRGQARIALSYAFRSSFILRSRA